MTQHVRSKAAASHAKKHCMGKTFGFELFCELLQVGDIFDHLWDDIQPTQPVADLLLYGWIILPDAGVILP